MLPQCCNRCMNTPNVDLPSYRGYRLPVTLIGHCVGLYFRFSLSYRDIEEMMAERGVVVSYETYDFGPITNPPILCYQALVRCRFGHALALLRWLRRKS